MVIGSDSPSFALYENGLLIYRRVSPDRKSEFASVTFTPKEKEDFLRSLPLQDFNSFDNHYETTSKTDQPTNLLYVWDQGKRKAVSLYGSDWNSPVAKKIPPRLLEMVNKIRSFQSEKATHWTPSNMELMLWPHPIPKDKALPWPSGWPGLNSPQTKKRGNDSYSIYLDRVKFDKLDEKVRASGGSPTLLIDGKTWAASFRYPFPGEENWMK